MMTIIQAGSSQFPWHRQGMLYGMHWAWWLIWFATIVGLLWTVWRLHSDRVETHREVVRRLSAEEILRTRFAKGEISEEEYASRLRALSDDPRVDNATL